MTWSVDENEISIKSDGALGTVFSVGNGHFCTRGSISDRRFDTHRSTNVAGVFAVAPHGMPFFMGAPDWTQAWIEINNTRAANISTQRILDMSKGLLTCTTRLEHGDTTVDLTEERFASFDLEALGAQRITVRRVSGTGSVSVVLAIDSEVRSNPSKYYPNVALKALDQTGLKMSTAQRIDSDSGILDVILCCPVNGIRSRAIARLHASNGCAPKHAVENGMAVARYPIPSAASDTTIVKTVIISGDIPGYRDAMADSESWSARVKDLTWDEALENHVKAVSRYWDKADVVIDGDERSQLSVRHALWSTRIASALDDGHSSIGARNLNGDMYRGGVFWDVDLWQFPMMLVADAPRAANHIRYRHRNLDLACGTALQDGYEGATYVGAHYGVALEGTRKSGFGYHEIHMNGAVCWAIDHYVQMTGDFALLLECGLEIFIEIARYWASRMEFDVRDQLYHIRYVVGPDEFKRSGVDDNAYTNIMAAYTLKRARELWQLAEQKDPGICSALSSRLAITPEIFTQWEMKASQIHIPFITDKSIIEQYEGYRGIPEPDSRLNKGQWGFIDKTSKQADTLLLWQIDVPCAWERDSDMAARCWREYAPICHHLSSLSYCTHAIVAARLGFRRDAGEFYRLTQDIDLNSESSESGGHGAGEGGVWLATVWAFGGFRAYGNEIHIDPLLPRHWSGLSYSVVVEGCQLEVKATQTDVSAVNKGNKPIRVHVANKCRELKPNQSATEKITRTWTEQASEVVLIEMDPLLVDTTGLRDEVWREICMIFGFAHPQTASRSAAGLSGTAAIEAALSAVEIPLTDITLIQDIAVVMECLYKKLANDPRWICQAKSAVAEVLNQIRGKDLRVATVTQPPCAATILNRCKLSGLVDICVDSTIARVAPPDPDMLLVACQRLRILPWNAVAAGCSQSFLEAARALGMRSVQLSEIGELTPERLLTETSDSESVHEVYR